MKFTAVLELPIGRDGNRRNWRTGPILDEVMNMNAKFVKFEFDKNEYKSAKNVQTTYGVVIKKCGYPLRVRTLDGEVYFIRTDM